MEESDIKYNKNLVYFCIFHNSNYMELFKILMTTVKLFSRTDTIDFLVVTSKEFEPLVDDISNKLQIPILKKFYKFTSLDDTICSRLLIFEYENINLYERILYLDTDIIIQNDLTTLFEIPLEDKIYAIKEGTIEHEYHGGWFFDFNKIDKNISGMNSGILLFNNTIKFRTIFNDIWTHISSLKEQKKPQPACLDQAFINYYCVRNLDQNTDLMDTYGLIYCIDPPPPPSNQTDVILCHFVWPLGNALHKKNRMVNHMNHVFRHYKTITKNNKQIDEGLLFNKTFQWQIGQVKFNENKTVNTSWGNGIYEWLDSNTLMVSWCNIDHIIRINEDCTNYFSIRVGDMDYISGPINN